MRNTKTLLEHPLEMRSMLVKNPSDVKSLCDVKNPCDDHVTSMLTCCMRADVTGSTHNIVRYQQQLSIIAVRCPWYMNTQLCHILQIECNVDCDSNSLRQWYKSSKRLLIGQSLVTPSKIATHLSSFLGKREHSAAVTVFCAQKNIKTGCFNQN